MGKNKEGTNVLAKQCGVNNIPSGTLRKLHEIMLKIRRFEEKVIGG